MVLPGTDQRVPYVPGYYSTAGQTAVIPSLVAGGRSSDALTNNHGTHLATDLPKPSQPSGLAQRPRFPVSNKPLSIRTETNFPYGMDSFGLRRGAMIRIQRDASNPGTRIVDPKNRYTFNFLFNPDTLNFSNGSFAGVVPPQYKNTNDNLAPMFVGQESLSFNLLLDRTQEAYEEGLSTRGTLDDVEAAYRVINGDFGSSAGYLSLAAVEIHFGPWTQNGHPVPVFPCYITSLSVTHTQFTPRMCPIRTTLQISATRLVGVGGQGGGVAYQIGGGSTAAASALASS